MLETRVIRKRIHKTPFLRSLSTNLQQIIFAREENLETGIHVRIQGQQVYVIDKGYRPESPTWWEPDIIVVISLDLKLFMELMNKKGAFPTAITQIHHGIVRFLCIAPTHQKGKIHRDWKERFEVTRYQTLAEAKAAIDWEE